MQNHRIEKHGTRIGLTLLLVCLLAFAGCREQDPPLRTKPDPDPPARSIDTNSGGTAALSWEAPEGLGDDKLLIIRTDGTHDFGSGPNPKWTYYEDFRAQPVNEQYDASLAQNVTITRGDGYPMVTDQAPFVGPAAFNAAYQGNRNSLTVLVEDPTAPEGAMYFTEFFGTYALKLWNDIQPGGSRALGNMKPMWTMLGENGFFNFDLDTATRGNDIVWVGAPGGNGGSTVFGSGNSSPGTGIGTPGGWAWGDWNVVSAYFRLEDTDDRSNHKQHSIGTRTALGDVRRQTTSTLDDGYTSLLREDFVAGQPAAWDRHIISGYFDNRSGSDLQGAFMDLIYFAMGPNAQARCFLSEHANPDVVRHEVLARPVSWSNHEIHVRLNQGDLPSIAGARLHIVKGNGHKLSLRLLEAEADSGSIVDVSPLTFLRSGVHTEGHKSTIVVKESDAATLLVAGFSMEIGKEQTTALNRVTVGGMEMQRLSKVERPGIESPTVELWALAHPPVGESEVVIIPNKNDDSAALIGSFTVFQNITGFSSGGVAAITSGAVASEDWSFTVVPERENSILVGAFGSRWATEKAFHFAGGNFQAVECTFGGGDQNTGVGHALGFQNATGSMPTTISVQNIGGTNPVVAGVIELYTQN